MIDSGDDIKASSDPLLQVHLGSDQIVFNTLFPGISSYLSSLNPAARP